MKIAPALGARPRDVIRVRRRLVLSSVTLPFAMLSLLVACSDDPAPAEPIPSEDGGVDSSAPSNETEGGTDAGPDASSEGLVGLGRVVSKTMLALSRDRTRVYGWGANLSGVYRTGGPSEFAHPVNMDVAGVPEEPFRAVLSTGGKTCLLTEAGRVLCFGRTIAQDSLGVGDEEGRLAATPLAAGDIPANVKIVAIDLFAYGGCVVGDDGEAYCWGDFHRVPDADPAIETVTAPHRILRTKIGDAKIVDVTTDINVSCVLAGGRAYCWFNGDAEPVEAGDLPLETDLLQVRSNDDVVCGTANDGEIYCWGSGLGRRFGTGSADFKSDAPYTRVSRANLPNGVKFKDVAVGGVAAASCGIGTDGWAYCWGSGRHGAAGDDDTTEHEVLAPKPIVRGDIPEGVTIVRVACGMYHCTAEGSDHVMYSWGFNEDGVLGASLPLGEEVGHPVRMTAPRIE